MAVPDQRVLRLAGTALVPLAVIGLASVAVTGWLGGPPVLRRFGPNLPEVPVNVALCLLLLAVAQLGSRRSRAGRVFAMVLAGLAGAVAAATLAEWVFRLDLGIDRILAVVSGSGSLRMSTQAAGTLLVLAATVLAARWRGGGWWPVQAAALAAATSGLAALTGLAFRVPEVWDRTTVVGMSLPGAAGMLGMGLAVVLSAPDHGVARLLIAPGAGGWATRLLLPVALMVPVTLAVLLHWVRSSGAIADEEAWTLLVVIGMVLPAAAVLGVGAALGRAERRRGAAEARAQVLIESAAEAIVVVDVERARFISVNRPTERLLGLSRRELLGLGPADVSPPEQADGTPSDVASRRYLCDAVRDGACTFEWLHRSSSGGLVECEVRLVRLPGSGPVLVRGSVVDVGARRGAERERQRLAAEKVAAQVRAETLLAERVRAERLAEQRATLLQLAEMLERTTGVAHLAQTVTSAVATALGARTSMLMALWPTGEARVLAANGCQVVRPCAPTTDLPLINEIVQTGRPTLIPSRQERLRRYPHLADRSIPEDTWALLPLLIEGQVTGVIGFGWADPREFDDPDREVLRTVAAQCAVALDRARWFDAERSARTLAENAQARLSLLAEAGQVVAEARQQAALCDGVARLLATHLGDWCGVFLPDATGNLVRTAAAGRDAALDAIAVSLLSAPAPSRCRPIAECWQTCRPARAERIPDVQRFYGTADVISTDELARLPAGSTMAVPLVARGETVGVLHLSRHAGSIPFDADDEQILTDVGRRVGSALDNLRLLAVRTRVAAQLQESLLPQQLPAIPHAELAARYLAGDESADVGGDFYDAFPLGGDEYALVIGDVCGRGPDAAGLTGLARTTLRALGNDVGPAAALARLNELLFNRTGGHRFLTAAYLRVGPLAGPSVPATFCLGGHPPPIAVSDGGTIRRLGKPGRLLGALPAPALTEQTVYLTPGDTVLLYTDGMTEAKGGDGMFGEHRLATVLANLAGRSAEDVVAGLEQALLAYRDTAADDTALLVLRLLAQTESGQHLLLDLNLSCDIDAVPAARHAVAEVLTRLSSQQRRADVLLGVSELVTNAYQQLRRQPTCTLRPDPIRLRVLYRPGVLRIEVHNPGPVFTLPTQPRLPDATADTGRGLAVVRALSTQMGTSTSSGETCVWFEVTVPRQALPEPAHRTRRQPRR